MVVNFFRYGNGMSTGPINYFLGKNFDREYAHVLDGNLAEVSALIDTSPFEKKYTSGCMSFYEHDLDDSVKKRSWRILKKHFSQAWIRASTACFGLSIKTR